MISDHLEKLKYFHEIAKLGSFKRASESLHITQPSLSKSMKILEEAIQKKLFIRLPRGIQLTEEGEVLSQYCYELFNSLSHIEQKLEAPFDPMAGSLKVGTYESIAINFWPNFLKSFLIEHTNLNFEITTGRSRSIQEAVEKGELDLGLIIEPSETGQCERILLGEDRFFLYQSTHKKKVYDDIEEAPIILMRGALGGKNKTSDEEFLSHIKTPNRDLRFYRTSSLESVREFTIKGLGLGLLPSAVAKEGVETKKIERVNPFKFPIDGIGIHNVGVIYSQKFQQSPIVKVLIERLKKVSW